MLGVQVSIGKTTLKDIKYVGEILVADTSSNSPIRCLKMALVIIFKRKTERSEAEVEVIKGLSVCV